MKPVLAAARQSRVYHISLAHGYPLAAVVVILGDCTHRHRPGFDPDALVVDVVGGADLEEVAFARLAHERRLGLGGIRQPGGPGAGDAHFVLHIVAAQAGLSVLTGPGDAEVDRGHGRRGDGHGGRDGILEEGEGLRRLVAGAVGGGDGQGGAEGVVGVEGIGVRPGCGGGAAQAVSSPGAGRLGEGQAEDAGQRSLFSITHSYGIIFMDDCARRSSHVCHRISSQNQKRQH
jgi:hypothetical protein